MSKPDRYLLDTSVIIDLPGPTEITSDAEYLISTITVAELNVGIHTADNPVQRSERLTRLQWVSDTFDPLVFTVATARMYGQLVALSSRRRPQPPTAPNGSPHRRSRRNPPAPAANQKPRRLHRPAPATRPDRTRAPTWVGQHSCTRATVRPISLY